MRWRVRAGTLGMAVAAALAAGSAARADEAPAAVRARLVALTQELVDAIAAGRAAVWERLLADDAVVVDEFGRRQEKRAAVADLRPLPEGLSGSIEVRDPRVRAYGAAAVVDCELYERETVFGQQLVVRYRATLTYVRRRGAWRLAAMHDVTIPTEPPALAVAGVRLDDYPGTYEYAPGRGFVVRREGEGLRVASRRGGDERPLLPVAVDVFTDGGEEKNLLVFRRDDAGRVDAVVERRKYNDLVMRRVEAGGGP